MKLCTPYYLIADNGPEEGIEGSQEGADNPMTTFDPGSPNAFTPPDYDSLPKEPPKYSDIYGNSNMAFDLEEETSFHQGEHTHHNESPPQYMAENETRSITSESHHGSPLTPVESPETSSLGETSLAGSEIAAPKGADTISISTTEVAASSTL